MRKLIATLFVAALLLSPHTSLFTARADSRRARGTIRAVDTSAHTVTLITRQGDTLVLQTDEHTEILRNGAPARLSDLQPGDRAVVEYDSATLVAARIEARGDALPELARVEGTISAVDTAARTLSILPLHSTAVVTLNIKPNTEITLDGRPARLDDLARGFTAAASYNATTFDAARVNAESFPEVRGTVRDVGFVEHTLTIAPSSGAPAITLTVSPGTPISLNDRPATLDDLRRGFRVVASYVATTHAAVRIAATSIAEVTGHLRLVDLDTATVVITPLVEGAPVELQVIRSTVITIGGDPASLDQLRAGMAVHAVYHITTFEALVIEARPLDGSEPCTLLRVAGRIANVSLHSATVTIVPNDGGERVTLNVVPRTEITINDRPARLDELREGMRVRAQFCRESLIAKTIAARAPTQ